MYNSFLCSLGGFRTVFREERNFKIEVGAGALILASACIVDFSWIERALLLVAVFTVIAAEIINTTLEDLCDKVEPGHDPTIGKIKDMMAAYVLVSVVGAVLLGVTVYANHYL